MSATDIVGYTYDAETLCPSCTMSAMVILPDMFPKGCEDMLDQLAALGANPEGQVIDRQDESSFDSNSFPKVIFDSQVENDEQCMHCGEKLIQ